MKNSFLVSLLICSGVCVAQTQTSAEPVVAAASKHSSLDACGPAKVNFGGDLQFRYSWNSNKDAFFSDRESGFHVPLAKIHMMGDVGSGFDYRIQGAFEDGSDEFKLLDAYVGFEPSASSRIQVGQFKLPYLAEINVGDDKQLAADSSLVSYIFGQGFSQGVMFSCGNDTLSFSAAFSDGFNSANTSFTDASESDYALTARVDWALAGTIHDADDFTATKDQSNALIVGGAAHFQDGDTQDSLFGYTADITWKNHGFSALFEGVGQIETNASADFSDYGLVAQAGYRITDSFEPFARFESVLPDSDRGFTNDYYNLATVGVNYYIYGQAAKFTVDGVYAFEATNELATMSDFSHTSLLGSSEADEIALRAQLQVKF